jgi:chitodextrinase
MKSMKRILSLFFIPLVIIAAVAVMVLRPSHAAAACSVDTNSVGSITTTVSVPSTGTYRVWSRIMAPDSTNNSFLLELDDATCYTVGDSVIPANVWTWVDNQNADTNSTIDVALSAGSHTLKLYGREPGVMVDRVILLDDFTCVPSGFGDNCNIPPDTTPPTTAVTAPADGSTVSGTVGVSATASDDTGVTKVDFLVDGSVASSSTAAPYGFSWDSTTVANGNHTLSSKAYDAAGNSATAPITVTVANGDQQAPTVPSGLTANATAYNSISLTWAASSDNVAVTGYRVIRNGVTIAQLGPVLSYTDTPVTAQTTYSYQVTAFDAAGNSSALSTAATATTPAVPDTTAPSAPSSLIATVASSTQINVSWKASTDNVGVAGYDVYRNNTKVATVTSLSYGDTGLSPSTTYSYMIKARDAANNTSAASNTATATTPALPTTGTISGTIKNRNGAVISGAYASVTIKRSTYTYSVNSSGIYTIPGLAPGSYTVTYRAKNYKTTTATVSVTAGKTTTQNVVLR